MSKPHHPSRGKIMAHSVEVGALAPVFEKSATQLKLKSKPKVHRCKNVVSK